MAVYEVSRTALGDHWNSGYPECQLMDDDVNTMELEFLWALTTLWQEINDLSLGIAPNNLEVRRRIEQRFKLLEIVCNILTNESLF
jgi:hypothetical protein